jgi:hypothetical protein
MYYIKHHRVNTLERITREKEWHNQTFGQGIRSPLDKFYSIHMETNKKLET